MGKWLRIWTKIDYYHHPIVGLFGLVVTVMVASPGTHVSSLGPLRVDPFYVSLVGFGSLLVLSLTDEYDPEAYGLESVDDER